MNPKPIIRLDASMLANTCCIRKLYLTLIGGYRGKLNSQEIEFGQAFHLCAKITALTDGNIGKGVQAAVKYYKETPYIVNPKKKYMTDLFLNKVCLSWFDDIYSRDSFDYLKDNNGAPLVELKFAIPFYSSDICDILLCGTMDKQVVHRTSRLLAIGDFKTSGAIYPDGYLDSYRLKVQLRFYTFVLKWLLKNNVTPESSLAPFIGKDIGCFIDGVFINAPTKGETLGRVEFARSKVMVFSKEDLAEFENLLYSTIADIEKCLTYYRADNPPPRQGIMNGACGNWGGCAFEDYCALGWDEVGKEHVLKNNFVQRTYDPLNFHGE